jgi:DNA (cytosine-5)-methyltransferase 1
MSRPRLLDLYCCAGGASVGYHRAGFDVTGVDIEPQPDYPYEFVQADALEYLDAHGREYDAIHASPPCTEHTTLTTATSGRNDATGTRDLLCRTIDALSRYSVPWVVENVMGARMPTSVVLCGTMFGLRVYRHRRFLIGPAVLMLAVPEHPRHRIPAARSDRRAAWQRGDFMTATGDNAKCGSYMPMFSEAMGIDWIAGNGLAQAIPPAYCEFIGAQLIDALEAAV